MTSRTVKQPSEGLCADRTLRDAVGLLSWDGYLIPDVKLMGTTFSAVVEVDPLAHQWRVRNKCAFPVTDPETLTMWEWPEGRNHFPQSAISLVGIAVWITGRWSEGLEIARQWRGFSPTAIIHCGPPPDALILECTYSGIAMVDINESGFATLVQVGRARHAQAKVRRSTSVRWVEESLYHYVLADGLADTLI